MPRTCKLCPIGKHRTSEGTYISRAIYIDWYTTDFPFITVYNKERGGKNSEKGSLCHDMENSRIERGRTTNGEEVH